MMNFNSVTLVVTPFYHVIAYRVIKSCYFRHESSTRIYKFAAKDLLFSDWT